MIVHTSRFGAVEVDEDRTITFARGILGFPKYGRYALIQPEPDATFFWLQSVEAADLAFVVTDPLLFVPDYQVPLREETRQDLGLADLSEASVKRMFSTKDFMLSRLDEICEFAGIEFADRGTHVLKGVPDDWQVFAARV